MKKLIFTAIASVVIGLLDAIRSPASATISTAGAIVKCAYVDGTVGYRCHTF